MKNLTLSLAVLLATASAAQAACYADYKAKQDNPLRLHYGVAEILGECSRSSAEAQLPGRLSADGWQLLNVLGVFQDDGLDQRKDTAGEYFLRY